MSEPDIPSVAREICAKSTFEPTSSSEQIKYKTRQNDTMLTYYLCNVQITRIEAKMFIVQAK